MPTDPFDPGTLVTDRYRIERFLAAGGVASVYEAVDTETDEPVVVRTPNLQSANDTHVVDRYFEKERAILRQLTESGTHRNVAELLAYGSRADSLYTVVTQMSGTRLDRVLDANGPITDVERLRAIGISLCDTVTFAHRAGVLVRDLKPDNVLLSGERRIKLFDFNTATVQDRAEISLSNREHNWGTTILPGRWRPPEIAHSDSNALNQGPWSDVYAIGLLLYYLFRGSLPENPSDIEQVELRTAPRYLTDILVKAVDIDPERRFGNALALGLALRSRSVTHVPEAELSIESSGEVESIMPGDTIGRVNGGGPAPSIGIVDASRYVSAIHCSIEVDREGRWYLADQSTNGTLVRRAQGVDSGQWLPVGRLPTPDVSSLPVRYEDNVQPSIPVTQLTDGDEIALVNPRLSFGARFQFRVPDRGAHGGEVS